ncbi:MAG: phosphoribosyltransferase family protein [Frankiaceae bacterium]
MAPFSDREDGGRALAEVLAPVVQELMAAAPDPTSGVVLGLPRGGVPVAAVVAARLGLPLDVLVVRKIGMPGHPELALGALGSGGSRYLNEELINRMGVTAAQVAEVVAAEEAELVRRETAYRAGRPALVLHGRTVILVDDGLATGASMRAAALAVRSRRPAAVLAAAPVGPDDVSARLADVVDRVVLARTPPSFRSVGACYADFSQTSDDVVRAALLGGGTPTA